MTDDHKDFALDCAEIAAGRYNKGEIDRRTFLGAIAALGIIPAAASIPLRGAIAAPDEIVVVNWGGPAIEAYEEAFGIPFEKDTGIKVVIDGTGPSGGKMKAMVESGAVTWDVCDSGIGTTLVLGKAGILEPIDYSIVDKSKVYEKFIFDHGLANYLFSFALTYAKSRVPRAPTGWKDFWDLETFPGKRTMRKNPIGMLESTMMAEGVPIDKVYEELSKPDGLDRALAKVAEIKDEVIFWGSGSESQQLFRTGEVVMGNIWHTRALLLHRETGGDIEWTWNQGVVTCGTWVVPKGNPAGKAAMEFIASSQAPEQQISLFKAMGNGPANPAAAELVPDDLKQYDPGQKANYDVQLPFNGEWYLEHQETAVSRYLEVISG
ncbi:ABC transporter substrate-binding protein [Kaustia mangrovi]|uniref:ABC transporter substrate-binding protein n=1 Tax=Kaustia mangrovi TaxID=2593653 RepID=A0A7S8C761_9HYPH|nr:ABC transporter substrate-binding protein [Kaustia mangrovi]QPC44587.1 ABC transporter substrate-binding protein [Kaustia mangrovi]